ncbi:MAG: molecular chaperone SurA [Porticoccaceae bacterium]|nr:molecular chaperone SurA [Porticoccaceae bacterium]
MSIYKRRLGAFALFVFAALPALVHSQELDRIVAIVDDGVVTKSQLDDRLDAIRQRFVQDPTQLPPADVLREQIIERLIIEEVQLQLAARSGVRPASGQVDQAFAELAASNGMQPQAFLNQLTALGDSSATKIIKDLQNELTIQQLQQIQIPRRIQITDAEVDLFLESAEGQMFTAPELLLSHIFLPLASNAGPGEITLAEESAALLIREYEAGANFNNLAVQYSGGSYATDGGQLGWVRAIEFAPEIGDALQDVEIDDLVGPLRSAGGLHLFLVQDIRGGDVATMVQQTKTRHILIRPNEIRTNDDAKELIDLIHQQLTEGESFEELARTYSDDVANALDGGDLGWVLPGTMVAEFEQATDATPTGEFSEPVLTSFGWHVLLVEDRRDVDMSNDMLRQQATNVLGNQRFEEELDLWIREIRSEAFIQIVED